MGLRLLHNDSSDFAIGEMVRIYNEVDVPVTIYVEEVCDPLLVIDTQGNILPKIMTGGDKDAEMNLLMSGIDFTDDYESVATQQFKNEDNIEKETENARNEGEIQMEVDKGKRKVTNTHIDEIDSEDSRSVFDDSSNVNYTQHQWTDEENSDVEPESDQNSLVYEDIEASSDEDIFLEKNLSKRQMMMKLRKMLKQKSKKKNINHDAGAKDYIVKDNGWYSDPGEEDELQSLDGNDLEGDSHAPNYPYFKTGQVFVVVGRDGNDNMWPIALAVVPVENREMWTWFLTELSKDLGGIEQSYRWTFILDRQKGLLDAVKQLAPHSEHRFCLRHKYKNFKHKFKSPALKELFWKAASTASKTDFRRIRRKLMRLTQNLNKTS
ncbi:UNVERIFIED_CONTAM: hypothetical protein Sradi_2626300 [Sesamum radiatum]|uniref:MULE transposase domain-containing protein n=1 Tax=Sesamum radiatum TaxID=300843 RepID=A0AAW2S4F6_SESRA